MIDYTQGRKDVCYLRKNFEVKTIETSEKPKEEVFDAESVNERLGNGDLEALEELEKHKITYQLEENANGYKVKYSYEGTNYTIVCYGKSNASGGNNNTDDSKDDGHTLLDSYLNRFTGTITINPEWNDDINYESKYPSVGAPDTGAPVNPPVEDSVEEPEANPPVNPPVDEPVDTPEEDSYRFDYEAAGVDKDANIADFWNGDPSDKELLGLLYGHEITSGWDALLAELDKMRPQLLEYLKSVLETLGLEFDSTAADKYIDICLTMCTLNILGDDAYKNPTFGNSLNGPDYSPNTTATIEDIINSIKENIEACIPDSSTNVNGKNSDKTSGEAGLIEFKSIGFALPSVQSFFKGDYINNGEYLLYTDDYFLTENEQKLKECLGVKEIYENGGNSWRRLVDVQEYIDCYAELYKNILQEEFPYLTESECDSIVARAASEAKSNPVGAQENANGMTSYSLPENLINFEELCRKYAILIY